MCLRLNTSAGAMPASITVQRAALFAGAAMSKAHVTGRANTWSGATMINRRLLFNGAGGDSDPVPELPDQDTLLLHGFGPGTVTIKIPDGCNVVKLYYDVSHEHEGFVEIYAHSVKTGVWWCEAYEYESVVGDIYIGVTSGAEYTLSVMTNSETGTESGYISIYYSKSINAKTPNKTDYIK